MNFNPSSKVINTINALIAVTILALSVVGIASLSACEDPDTQIAQPIPLFKPAPEIAQPDVVEVDTQQDEDEQGADEIDEADADEELTCQDDTDETEQGGQCEQGDGQEEDEGE